MEQTETIRALLVDDHALFRESVARVLGAEPALEVEHCGSIKEALQLLAQRHFDLVLLDHDLGSERASQFLPAARQEGFEGRVLVVTAWVSDTEARRLMRQGVSGIFLKESPLSELSKSIRIVAAGGTWLADPFSRGPEQAESSTVPVFNDRQRQVLRFVLEGLSNKEIAWRLQISESYVKAILQSLFQKTGVRTRGQLVRVAFEQYEDQL
ncbi:MAG TPA: response regulator transcription factor [Candidatus Sulfopaludibacter sp.]|jgi:two-component system nitrate/nitrite response regulator NarL|nr:response regulator transcription factor [Candidatus Sulfopaludibacter sp.]